MTYILSAFETEARALIDFYKLSKKNNSAYKIFYNEDIFLIISGMGQERASEAIEYLILNYPNKKEDIFINLGICAGQKKYKVGELLHVETLTNNEESHKMAKIGNKITQVSCFSSKTPVSSIISQDIAEMEAMSIYKVVRDYFKHTNISFLKIVSDNFNPQKFSKQFVIDLTFNNLEKINSHIQDLNEK